MSPLNPSAPCFVTGASGFIGRRLVAELIRRGYPVRALVRPATDRTAFPRRGISFVVGGLADPRFLTWAMDGCASVIHLAACARSWAPDRRKFFRLNVDGAWNVVQAAHAAGVARIVHTSTIVTLGPTAPGVIGDETTPRSTWRYFTDYEESKTLGERQVLAQAAAGAPVVIVNPTRVYGPGRLSESNAVTLLCDLRRRGRAPFLLDGGGSVGNYVLVDDLVQGVVLALEHGRIGERYILGGENASQERLFDLMDEAGDRRRWRVRLSRRAALAYARFEERKALWLGIRPRITPGWVETLLADWAYSCAKAQRELGYRATPLKDGLRLTYDWLRRRRTAAEG